MRRASIALAGIVILSGLVVASTASATSTLGPGGVELHALSNRADLLSGGDVLVDVVFPPSVAPARVRVGVGGRDVTARFFHVEAGRLRGLVSQLPEGTSTLVASVAGGAGARLALTNHSINGPIFSGRQLKTWLCETADQPLGPSEPPTCAAPTRTELFYRTLNGLWAPYREGTPSSEVAQTTTDQGKTVPFIVRQEVGTMNRGIYSFATLWDPASRRPAWLPGGPSNRKLLVTTGGGSGVKPTQGTVSQITPGQGDLTPDTGDNNPTMLGRGFIVAGHSLNRGEINTNGILAAESLMMMKERIAEVIGPIRFAFGSGGSGGSATQNNITAAYPGLLDGVILGASFMEWYTDSMQGADWKGIYDYFAGPGAAQGFTPVQMGRISGNTELTGSFINGNLSWYTPEVCGDQPWAYEDQIRPTGFRCTLVDHQAAAFGARSPSRWGTVEKRIVRGFAPRPLDNVGVQYGLEPLLDGSITPEQFVHLNENVGGFDIDYNPVPQRTEADPEALDIAYRTGRIPVGTFWDRIPILDLSGTGNVEIHIDVRGYNQRARVQKAHGTTANYVKWKNGPSERDDAALLLMDRWLTAIEADSRAVSLARKVVDNKPSDAVDRCYANGVPLSEDPEVCGTVYPSSTTGRIVAGGPLAEDIQKCQLKPLSSRDYATASPPMTAGQYDRLQRVFPNGVCDWTKPGVGHQQNLGWVTFGGGPSGRPLPTPPTSTPIRTTAEGVGAPMTTPPLPATGGAGPGLLSLALLAAGALGRAWWRGSRG